MKREIKNKIVLFYTFFSAEKTFIIFIYICIDDLKSNIVLFVILYGSDEYFKYAKSSIRQWKLYLIKYSG